jgi:hypothetical protein
MTAQQLERMLDDDEEDDALAIVVFRALSSMDDEQISRFLASGPLTKSVH